jgi:hypothetical protein
VRVIDLDLDRDRINADEGESIELGEHDPICTGLSGRSQLPKPLGPAPIDIVGRSNYHRWPRTGARPAEL